MPFEEQEEVDLDSQEVLVRAGVVAWASVGALFDRFARRVYCSDQCKGNVRKRKLLSLVIAMVSR